MSNFQDFRPTAKLIHVNQPAFKITEFSSLRDLQNHPLTKWEKNRPPSPTVTTIWQAVNDGWHAELIEVESLDALLVPKHHALLSGYLYLNVVQYEQLSSYDSALVQVIDYLKTYRLDAQMFIDVYHFKDKQRLFNGLELVMPTIKPEDL